MMTTVEVELNGNVEKKEVNVPANAITDNMFLQIYVRTYFTALGYVVGQHIKGSANPKAKPKEKANPKAKGTVKTAPRKKVVTAPLKKSMGTHDKLPIEYDEPNFKVDLTVFPEIVCLTSDKEEMTVIAIDAYEDRLLLVAPEQVIFWDKDTIERPAPMEKHQKEGFWLGRDKITGGDFDEIKAEVQAIRADYIKRILADMGGVIKVKKS